MGAALTFKPCEDSIYPVVMVDSGVLLLR